jgi:hypothetical protein
MIRVLMIACLFVSVSVVVVPAEEKEIKSKELFFPVAVVEKRTLCTFEF